ncbi:Fe-S-containing hydro-lyase [Alkaliphilus hydrothermalis]|uniref:Fumarate hydratase subunit beta n=1 Tax=Alkaliphilus hydrothermalis TaxID=1482730 RepID=A0ABS2NSX2_9FIRM|nr:Fe-S-containing hydro-lyase [Alkaliphilus hydrothermalis]MBM7615972.1 fumarate hydratase subunit beta [Alkaliphilus hydrothermalis]
MKTHRITTPLKTEDIEELKVGDKVLLSGYIYTARDAAHQRLIDQIKNNEELPFQLEGQVLYYVGPTPAPEGKVIGSAGPTTSLRMDRPTPTLLDLGLKGMIGKGDRSIEVVESIKKNGCVYFAALGGAGALIANSILTAEVIAYEDLGTEAIRRLEVKELPVVVAIDQQGNNLYHIGPDNYKKDLAKVKTI